MTQRTTAREKGESAPGLAFTRQPGRGAGRALGVEQVGLVGGDDELDPVPGAQLRQQPGHVRLGGACGDIQGGADLGVGHAQAHQIGESAAEFHRRLGALVPDLQKLGSSRTTAAARYNGLLASLESKVFPQVRQLESLGIFAPGTQLPEPPPLDAPIRPVAADCYQLVGDNDTGPELGSFTRSITSAQEPSVAAVSIDEVEAEAASADRWQPASRVSLP
jgi:hypothetical protein